MKPDKQILLSVGVLVEAGASHERLEAIGIAIRDAVTLIADGAGAEASTVINWDYLGPIPQTQFAAASAVAGLVMSMNQTKSLALP